MNLEQIAVRHVRYGRGTVLSCAEGFIRIAFETGGEKQFAYPDAFARFLRAEDPAAAAFIAEEIIMQKAVESAEDREREELLQAIAAAAIPAKKPAKRSTRKTK